MKKIIGSDNLARENVAETHLIGGIPDDQEDKAKEFCSWLNTFTCYDHGGTYYTVVDNDHRLWRGMEEFM